MKKVILFSVMSLLFIFTLVGIAQAFQNEPEGFRGVKWGDPPTEDMEYVGKFWERAYKGNYKIFVEDDKAFSLEEIHYNARWYQRRNDRLQIGRAKLEYIYYLFYENQFIDVQIEPELFSRDFLKDVVKLKFGKGERRGKRWQGISGRWYCDWSYTWSGDIATIILQDNYTKDITGGSVMLEIRSTKIYNQYQEDMRLRKEEEARHEEEKKRKAAEEGLSDF